VVDKEVPKKQRWLVKVEAMKLKKKPNTLLGEPLGKAFNALAKAKSWRHMTIDHVPLNLKEGK